VPYNDESEPENDYALDEVSSDVEMDPEDMIDLPSDEEEGEGSVLDDPLRTCALMTDACWRLPLCRRFEEIASDKEADLAKPVKRPRESDATEHDVTTGDKVSKKKAKKLKGENGAAAPAPATTSEDTSKKDKKNKKAKKGESKEGDANKGEGKEDDSKPKQGDKGGMRELPNGLKIQDAKPGEGPQAKKGMRVSMRYVGKLPNGKVFDSNTKGKPVRLSRANCTHARQSCDRLFLTVHI
jgi:FK506-binding nuclear protein